MTYLDSLATRIRAHVPEDVGIPDDADILFLLYALLGRAKGHEVSARDVHDAWVAWMALKGEDHESMVPFDELAPDVQAEDLPFMRAIRSALADGS